jgi:hypothetical protein
MSFVDINELDRRFRTCETGRALRVAPLRAAAPRPHLRLCSCFPVPSPVNPDPSWDALYLAS